MKDILSILNTLHRPRLMMRAARIGAEDYRRRVHLPRILGDAALPRHAAALIRLIDIEAELDAQRTGNDPNYQLVRHIDVLIAMVAEARDYRTAQSAARAVTPL